MNMHCICCVRIASGFVASLQKETSYAVFKCILSGTLIKARGPKRGAYEEERNRG